MAHRAPRSEAGLIRRLVLLGGGHAHLHLLANAVRQPLPATELVLVSPHRHHHYSGMIPGYLREAYAERELTFDLDALAARAGARFVRAAAERIDPATRTVDAAGERLAYDLLSLDIGSQAAGLDLPGVREHALAIRPLRRAVALRERAEALFAQPARREVALVVVGGGAAGVEVALALDRLGRRRGARPLVTIAEAGPSVLPEFSPRVRRLAARLLAEREIRTRTGRRVTAVEPGGVRFDGGELAAAELTVWIAGAAPPTLLANSALPKDPHGYLLVDDSLRAADGSPVFGAGDCIAIAGMPPLAKAGVYAVREAPVLDHNLRAALTGGRRRRYRPQASFLALLDSADGRALWRWHRLAGHARWARWLKERIDRGFVRRYDSAR